MEPPAQPSPGPTRPPAPPPPPQLAVTLLVAAAGALETISFLGLDRVFAGVMTSNLALLGMAIGQQRAVSATAAALALAGFAGGAAGAAWFTRHSEICEEHWHPRVVSCLVATTSVLVAIAAVWAAFDGAPHGITRSLLQFAAAVAMGIESTAMVAAGHAAAPTTYMTGTLATYIVTSVGSHRRDFWIPARFGALIVGAAISAVLLKSAPEWAAVPPVVLMLCALTAVRSRRSRL
ncbi:YoaK family protein [Streptomyces sp. NPDC127084]|uniref:YoaK family protein n=1 Tax=Streptomyces sp. NPDC127084 TaxID=3347133 RepID=UPI00365A4E40